MIAFARSIEASNNAWERRLKRNGPAPNQQSEERCSSPETRVAALRKGITENSRSRRASDKCEAGAEPCA
jgi:hypothetical protein